MVDRVVEVSEENGLDLKMKKPQFIVITNAQQYQENLIKNGEHIEIKVQKFKYIGIIFKENIEFMADIKSRIGHERNVFNKLKKVFSNRYLTIQLKI